MKPDFENELSKRMEQLSLNELMPGFDKEKEWMQLSLQLHPIKKRKFAPMWSYAAAILLLIAGGSFLIFLLGGPHGQPKTAQSRNITVSPVQPSPGIDNKLAAADTSLKATPLAAKPIKDKNIAATKKHYAPQKEYNSTKNYKTRDIVRNGTPCPIQITISQTMKCPDNKPSAISTSTTLEPDQSVKLTYKEHDKIAKNCSLTIQEIEIKSIATGETILLTASSFPSTAQDVFSYITGEKKGDILAGMFSSDCDHQNKKHNINLSNSYGNVIIHQ